ncbi:MAG: hypothetical protein MZW92_22305 [Comamonadaceae bacterium]|nr:hypothetical protein [Comamonadaceae bacterium]
MDPGSDDLYDPFPALGSGTDLGARARPRARTISPPPCSPWPWTRPCSAPRA